MNCRFKCERQSTKLLEGIKEDIFIFEKDIKGFFLKDMKEKVNDLTTLNLRIFSHQKIPWKDELKVEENNYDT